MAGLLTKGLKLSYSTTSSGSYTALTDLIGFPELGGKADSIEVTTMDDPAHVFMNGLMNYGDSLDFSFLYEATQFAALKALSGSLYWKVGIPDGSAGAIDTEASFQGECSVSLSGGAPNEPLKYVLSIKPGSAITFA